MALPLFYKAIAKASFAILVANSFSAAAQAQPGSSPEMAPDPSLCSERPAEAAPLIQPGTCMRSALGPGDPALGNATQYYEDYRVVLARGQTVAIDLDALPTPAAGQTTAPAAEPGAAAPTPNAQQANRPADTVGLSFDTYLELRSPAGQVLQSNDDRPGSLKSRLVFSTTRSGEYIIRARSLFVGEGPYVLRVSLAPAVVAEPTPITEAETQETMTAATPASTREGYRYRLYSFEGTARERVFVGVRFQGLGAILRLAAPNGRTIAVGRGLDPTKLIAVLPETGRYVLRLELPDRQASVPYTLQLTRGGADVVPPPETLLVGAVVEDALSIGSEIAYDTDGSEEILSFYRLYYLRIYPGVPVTLTLDSEDFDTVLDVGIKSPLGFATAVSNDDGGGSNTNSRVVLRAERRGYVAIRVRSFDLDVGRYTLRVEAGDRPLPPPLPIQRQSPPPQQTPAPPAPRQ
jgi:hypothetical protein